MQDDYAVIVIGGGVAGSAAALRAAQYGLKTAWVRGDNRTQKRSRGQWVANIDNMLGIHDGIVRAKILKELRGDEFAPAREHIAGTHAHITTRDLIENARERIEGELSGFVTEIELAATQARKEGDRFVVTVGEEELGADYLVLATGVMDRQPKVAKAKGEEVIDDPRWIYPYANRESILYCIRCEGHLTRGDRTAVIGHGPAAAELALMLHERYESACCVLTNGEEPAWSQTSQALLEAYGLEVHRERLVDVEGKKGELGAFQLAGGRRIEVQRALVSMGLYRVYNELARALDAELLDDEKPQEERHVRIDARGETSVRNLFAVGDMAGRTDERVMKQVYTSQEYAVRAVDKIDARNRRARRKRVLAAQA